MATETRLRAGFVAERGSVTNMARVPSERDFDDGFGNMRDFREAPDLNAMAAELIDQKPCLSHIQPLRVGYLWKRRGGSTKGREKLGQCQKPGGLLAHFSELDFVIWIAADHAAEHRLTNREVEAALFHELCHIGLDVSEDSEGEPILIGHDVEAFAAEVEEYGLWKNDLRAFGSAVKQLRMEDAG